MLAGKSIAGVFCDDPQDQIEWQTAARLCDDTSQGPVHAQGPQFTDRDWYSNWLTPREYQEINVLDYCLSRCRTDEQRQRVNMELDMMTQRNMLPILRHLIYCTDVWRQNGVVWGVGRGSSVCSFVLFLIGITRINPLEHGLDISEWLK
jgi:DNA polymerase III alpha subunit